MQLDPDDLKRLRMQRRLQAVGVPGLCDTCHGAGIHILAGVRPGSGPLVICVVCRGTGGFVQTHTCRLCIGFGWIPIVAWRRILWKRWSRRVVAKCPDCAGNGVVAEEPAT